MRQKNNQRRDRRETKAEAPKKAMTAEERAFERETERRRREMIRSLADRTAPIQNKRLKSLLWLGAPKSLHNIMRQKPVRRAPRGS
jgi:hypothetical protein